MEVEKQQQIYIVIKINFKYGEIEIYNKNIKT
jgi:hypothetical protein